jgi:hypothetical protein
MTHIVQQQQLQQLQEEEGQAQLVFVLLVWRASCAWHLPPSPAPHHNWRPGGSRAVVPLRVLLAPRTRHASGGPVKCGTMVHTLLQQLPLLQVVVAVGVWVVVVRRMGRQPRVNPLSGVLARQERPVATPHGLQPLYLQQLPVPHRAPPPGVRPVQQPGQELAQLETLLLVIPIPPHSTASHSAAGALCATPSAGPHPDLHCRVSGDDGHALDGLNPALLTTPGLQSGREAMAGS